MVNIKFDYKTTLPKEANAPSVYIDADPSEEFLVSFYNVIEGKYILLKRSWCKGGETIYSNLHQWFINWHITIYKNGDLIAQDTFNPKDKVVFIKIDAHALGDNISWIPYVEEFRKKHECKIICSTFFNDLFKDLYKEILFVQPNTNIENVYAQYYIGAQNENNKKYSNIISDEYPLQGTAYYNLELENKEIRPELEKIFKNKKPGYYNKKFVCISEFASSSEKQWKEPGGWQTIVNFLNSLNYDVVVISKEPTELINVYNLTGNHSILERAHVLVDAEFFIGVSSGLSWLSWAVNTHVFLISDVTPMDHEFSNNITRISANKEIKKVDYTLENFSNSKDIISEIKFYLKNNKIQSNH